jgi:hypothetical protein
VSGDIAIRNTDRQDDWNYAKALATAGDQLPRKFQGNPGNVLVAMEYARSLGLPLMQGLIGVQVIDGVPSLSAQTMQALVRRAGHILRIAGDDKAAWCEIVRKDDPSFTYRAEFTTADAERAGLCKVQADGSVRARSVTLGKPMPWETHTRAMLKARALSECARMACGDVLAGVAYLPDELATQATVIDGIGEWSETATTATMSGAGTDAPAVAENAPTDQPEAATVPPENVGTESEATMAARWLAEDQERWQADLSGAIEANRLDAVRELGSKAVQEGWTALAAQARGAYERVKIHLAAINDDSTEQR